MFDFLNYFLTFFVLLAPISYLMFIFYRFRKEILESKLIIIFLLLFTVVLFNKLLFLNQTIAAQDFNNIQIPFFHSLNNSLQKFYLMPIWISNFGGGFDSFSNPLAFYFSTFSLIFYFVKDTYFGANIYIVLQVFCLGIFSYLFLRELNFKKYSAFGGSLLLTFNGFVMMRLAPGVGIEYLFAYKWLPLILLFSYSYFYKKQKSDWIFLSIAIAFSFEGNPNISVAMFFLCALFLLFVANLKIISTYIDFLRIGFLSLSIFAIKLIPGVDLMLNSQGRISEIVEGWRVVRVGILRFIWYFLPYKDNYLAGPFTPGLIGFLIFFCGLVIFLIYSFRKFKFEKLYLFGVTSLILGLVLSSGNPLSDFIFSLPVLNRLTINPSFYVFLLIPLGIFGAYFYDFWYLKFPKYSKFVSIFIVIISFVGFIEILRGPSTFGKSTYSFNFEKMANTEVFSYPFYNLIKEKTNGNFVFYDGNKIFNLPNAISFNDLTNLNRNSYFYGTSYFNDLPQSEKLENYKIHSDYIVSLVDLNDSEIELVSKIDTRDFATKYQSFSIVINKNLYYDLIKNLSYDENLRIYKVSDSVKNKAVLNTSNHPYSYSFLLNEKNIKDGNALTSISYSKHWRVTNSQGALLPFEKDSNGLLIIKNVEAFQTIYLTYINWYIYVGLLVSFLAYIFVFFNIYKINYQK